MNRILVVDDESDCRRSLVRLLRGQGYLAQEAANGLEALVVCIAARPDLIVLDLNMPVMNGLAFLEKLRMLPQCHSVPVVLLTAAATSEVRKAMSLGIVGYFLKVHMAMKCLLECIGRILRPAAGTPQTSEPAGAARAVSDPGMGVGPFPDAARWPSFPRREVVLRSTRIAAQSNGKRCPEHPRPAG